MYFVLLKGQRLPLIIIIYSFNPLPVNVPFMHKTRWLVFTRKKTYGAFFIHFPCKIQLTGFFIHGGLAGNRLLLYSIRINIQAFMINSLKSSSDSSRKNSFNNHFRLNSIVSAVWYKQQPFRGLLLML